MECFILIGSGIGKQSPPQNSLDQYGKTSGTQRT
jgi:hypothetical protein